MKLKICKAKPSDASKISKINEVLYNPKFDEDIGWVKSKSFIRYRSSKGLYYIAYFYPPEKRSRPIPVGAIGFKYHNPTKAMEVHTLAVLPDYCGMSIGSELLKKVESEAIRIKGCEKMMIDSCCFYHAKPFYLKNGYEVYRHDEDDPMPYFTFRKDLTPYLTLNSKYL